MGYISIYRKWRPQSFSEIVGQDDIVKTLKNALKANRLSHAYMFCGPRGTGKTSTARILAKAINCKNREKDKNNPEPCNVCENCVSITNGTNVDVIEIDAASHRKVEPTRELIDRVNYLPNFLKKKVYIIDEVHMLTDAAFNTLLKTLEEPPEHVIFILATTEPNKVIPTILSRCQRFNFKPITSDSITGKLKTIASAENIDINDAALSLISKYSGGSQRDANVILEKLASLDEGKIKVEDVAALLGAVDFEILFELANIIIERNISEALFFEHRLQASYQNLRVFVEEFINHLQTLFVIKNYESAYEILNINAEYKEKYSDQSKLITNDGLQFYIDLFSDLYKELKISEGSRILFKSALIKAVTHIGTTHENKEKINNAVFDEKISVFDKELKNVNFRIFEIQKNLDNISGWINKKSINAENTEIKKEQPPLAAEKPVEKKESSTVNSSQEKQKNTEGSSGKEEPEHITDKSASSSSGSPSDMIKSNWDKICNAIKSKQKGIPLCAMFVEARKIKINKNSILFYLPNNSQFHKDNLNKAENIEKIEISIKEIIGKEFKVSFFFENEGEDFISIKGMPDSIKKAGSNLPKPIEKNETKADDGKEAIKEQIMNQYSKIREKPGKDNDFNNTENSNDSKVEEYNYLEKKFGIKEKKSGN